MTMIGIAIQVKYTVVIEGMFFGCYFLWRMERAGAAWDSILAMASSMILLALMPTIFATAYYARIGHLPEFVHANFTSIFARGSLGSEHFRDSAAYIIGAVWPAAITLPFAVRRRWYIREDGAAADFPLMIG